MTKPVTRYLPLSVPRGYLSTYAAANLAGVTHATVCRWHAAGILKEAGWWHGMGKPKCPYYAPDAVLAVREANQRRVDNSPVRLKGVPRSEATKAKISATMKGRARTLPRSKSPAYIRKEWVILSSVSTRMGRYDAEEQGRTAAIARSRSIFYLASRYVPGGIEWRYQDTMQDSEGWEVREQVLKNGARWESCPIAHPSVGAREGSLYNAPRRIA